MSNFYYKKKIGKTPKKYQKFCKISGEIRNYFLIFKKELIFFFQAKLRYPSLTEILVCFFKNFPHKIFSRESFQKNLFGPGRRGQEKNFSKQRRPNFVIAYLPSSFTTLKIFYFSQHFVEVKFLGSFSMDREFDVQ